jgi:ABC-2 type transport system ATP-binding protein
MNIVEVHNAVKHFNRGRIRALNDVSLAVPKGSAFGLLGPNGAGKTTLVKMLLGILYPTSGSATLFGQPISQPSVRDKVGYLPENHRYPDFLKGNEVLDYYGQFSAVPKELRAKRAPELLKLVGMEKWGATKIKKYSKGMMQRLGLAVALMNDPELLFLDEPTDGVDPIGRKEIRDFIQQLKNQGKTIFINSHLLSEVELVCDGVAIMNRGKIVVQGSVEQLTSTGHSYRMQTGTIPPNVLDALRSQFTDLQASNSHLNVTVRDYAELNRLIDRLREHQIELQAVLPHRRTLEESFFAAIQGAASGDFNEMNIPAEKPADEASLKKNAEGF